MSQYLTEVLIIMAVMVIVVLVARWMARREDSPIVLKYKLKGTYCEVWSPQLPGASSLGQTLEPAIGSFMVRHGKRLGVGVEPE